MSKQSDWSRPFQVGLSSLHLTERRYRAIEPLVDLHSSTATLAAKRIEDVISGIYLPTSTAMEWATEILSAGLNYAERAYPDPKTVLTNLYKPPEGDPEDTTYCLTGPAGVGKSQSLYALSRLMSSLGPWTAEVSGHKPIETRPLVLVTVGSRSTDRDIVRSVLEQVQTTPATSKTVRGLFDMARKCLYRAGTCAIVVDELQFMATSAKANAAVTKSLLLLRMLGRPLFFVANYSLCHRLLRRNQEDKQRLLSYPRVMLPEERGSTWWIGYLSEIRSAVPNVLQFDPVEDAIALHRMTMGLPRLLCQLIGTAVRRTHGTGSAVRAVRFDDLFDAYRSIEFSMHRSEIELMDRALKTSDLPSHLCCPFDIVPPLGALQQNARRLQIHKDVRYAALSPTGGDRVGFDVHLQGAPSMARPTTRRKKPATAESLAATYVQALECGVKRRRPR